ncbi:feline leukemia virus subgroup C receptor-related protein 2-like isoform X1 [Trichoplusia ni]|uniref:Choline/ethanolamine transporter FLVCR1 n=1 Tax=Trichoplusia ni TaxID=7111 RepID=A0A7E5WY63_TRINI|nr:feline leukemia virus subgroup C receptor-related protein 2-like isoform X1 [Trichoplusia ni]XP_026745795.1 feline leukemia virus subgroup C receptor-related protein 2-like isoform X1 [Trichoplusia ni]XP_026745796.1 feline leukemia virus subgroup C receptor-related protein 2-like isoform X1 [Trichoplusia ni]XP_026745798.1 feline leukemia virus subgroup C receptor-related protein 2-like isoform X1 [Trichoplusia ni]
MTQKDFTRGNGLLSSAEPVTPKIGIDDEGSRSSIAGSVMDDLAIAAPRIKYEVSSTRWIILGMFVIYSASNSMQWTQYAIIQDIVVKYYGVSNIAVSWTSMIYMLTYVPLIFPGSWLLDKTNLRVTTIIGSFGTCLGAWLKVFSVPQDMFWLGFMGQTVVAISQVFILNVPPRLAAVWFGADQVSSACSVGVFGNQLGVAVGFVLPPILVRASGTIEEIAADFRLMFYLVAGFTSVLFVFILLFFKAAPPNPPSAAADLGNSLDSNFLLSLKKLITNRNYVLLLISYGLNVGAFYAISTLLNQVILTYYPGANADAGRIGLVIVVAGMAGSVLCGLILDKTHRFKETTLSVYVASVIGMLIFTFTLDCGYIGVVYLSSILLGFFMTGYLPVGFEFASEVTYPEPEGTTSGILNAVVQVFGILTTLLYEWMLGSVGDRWANLTLCALLAAGAAITAAIRSDLRRQAAQNNHKG